MEKVLVVSEKNEPIKLCEKLEAHKNGALHRAFSVLIFNSDGEMLLQKRASSKYHSAGKWSNAACGHPLSEDISGEAEKRLFKEMGFETELEPSYTFHYTEKVGELWENEIDQVYTGIYNGKVSPTTNEVEDYKWVPMNELYNDMKKNPDDYSKWFQIIVNDNKF